MSAVPLNTLAERLTFARELRKLSRRELSLSAGQSQALVGLIERGEIENPRSDTMAAIARVLSVSLDWLIAGDGPMPSEAA